MYRHPTIALCDRCRCSGDQRVDAAYGPNFIGYEFSQDGQRNLLRSMKPEGSQLVSRSRAGYFPVKTAALVGEQTAHAAYASVIRTPSLASRSMFGV